MKLTPQETGMNDVDLEAWTTEARRKGQLIRTVLVNEVTGEAMEVRRINVEFIAAVFRTAVVVETK